MTRESTPLIDQAEEQFSISSSNGETELANARLEEADSQEEEQPQYDVTKIIISLWMGSFLSALDSTVVASTMSGIASEFHDSGNISWVAASYLLTNTAFQPLYGKTSDIVGRKQCLVFAQFWFGLGCFACCLSQNLVQFSIARAIAGIGGGGLSSLSSIVVSDIVSLKDRGMYQGYANVMFATAQSLGGPIGGFCLQTIGWRWMFALQVPMTIICMFLAIKYVNIKTHRNAGVSKENLQKIDFLGSGCLVIATSCLLFAFSIDNLKSLQKELWIVCIIFFIGFIYVENKVAVEPIIPPHLFKGVLGLTAFIAGFGLFPYYGIMFVVPLYLETIQDVSPSKTGVYIISQVVPVAFGSLYAGHLLRKHEENAMIRRNSNKLVVSSAVLVILGILLIQTQNAVTTPDSTNKFVWSVCVVMGLCLCGFGAGMLLVALLVLAVALVGKEGQAAASSMNYLFRSVSQVLGVGISLNFYKHKLVSNLTTLLKDEEQGEEILKKLLSDNRYLREGLSSELLPSVLIAFKKAITSAYWPGVVSGIISLILSILLFVW